MKVKNFFGYIIWENSTVTGKRGKPIKSFLSKRRGGKFDKKITLYIDGKRRNYTLSRLVAGSFQGYIEGFEIGHNDRDPLNCHNNNLSIETASQNQKHWRKDEKLKGNKLKTGRKKGVI